MNMPKPAPTENIRLLRGDWLLESLTAISRGQLHFQPIPTKPPMTTGNPAPGRFHEPTGKYWPDARESAAASPPMYAQVRIPGEEDINYPGERLTITPTWVRRVHGEFMLRGCYDAFRDYARGDDSWSVAYYSTREKRVILNGFHPKALHEACRAVSDLTPYEPVPDNALVPLKEEAHA